MTRELAEAVGELQLPISRSRLDDSIAALRDEFGLESDADLALLISDAVREWHGGSPPGDYLQRAVSVAGRAGMDDGPLGTMVAEKYFEVMERLESLGLARPQGCRLLARSRTIRNLLVDERLSCSQVARLLATWESSLDVGREAVSRVAQAIGAAPTLDRNEVSTRLWDADAGRASDLFPDGDVDECIQIAAEASAAYLPDLDLGRLLKDLLESPEGEDEPFWPYLQMLHFGCVPVEYFDHPPAFIYEFSPRGQVASDLFDQYPVSTGNPVLNNAKAVHAVDAAWARTRPGTNTRALAGLFETMGSLPSVSRSELARILRAWLHRVMELKEQPSRLMPEADAASVRALMDAVAAGETQTRGVIEQRLVDALVVLLHQGTEWRGRGTGDAVNASNFSRKKLGDVEFQNTEARWAVAYEAHGGQLSRVYIDAHKRSLARALQQRLEESWLALGDAADWRLDVWFVAHDIAGDVRVETEEMHGVEVNLSWRTYEDLIEEVTRDFPGSDVIRSMSRFVVEPLNQATTPQRVRDRFADLAKVSIT